MKIDKYNGTKLVLAIALTSLSMGLDARPVRRAAGPKCWTAPQIAAAKTYELTIFLNVQSLRCRSQDPTIMDKYNTFVSKSGATVKRVTPILKSRFGNNANSFDRYAISLANKYGGGVAGQSCGDVGAVMDSAIANAGDLSTLSQVADAAHIDPLIAGGACSAKSGKGSALHTTRKATRRRTHK